MFHCGNCVCTLRVMSEDKKGTVKYELSPDGDLKCKIKREKTVECAEWVTENRGNGLGKLIFKKKSPGSLPQSPKTSGLPVDRQTEQVPVLRLSLTSNASSDGSRHVQVKSWSLCEPEDAGCMSELSPACQLQQSPKDSGIDMSSPPHDDGAVGVESNVGAGIWSVSDSHNGDSSAVEEKTTSSLEKLETAVGNVAGAVHSSTEALWPDAASHCSERDQPKVQSTLRSRIERSAFKCFPCNSQKLINPLAKSHRVGRYQHMLPVHRIRAESNVGRRSSLEESPTYNMVASRDRLPHVKTKLKLLSNNTYAAVFDEEMDSSKQQAADQKSKCLNAEKSNRAVGQCKKSRLSRKSSASNRFENIKVKLCYSDKNNRHGLDGDHIQRVPKLKLVVKSERAVSVSCLAQQTDSGSVTASVKHDEENMPRHIRRKRRHHEVKKMKTCNDNKSADLCYGFSAGHLPSSKAEDARSSRPHGKSSRAKRAAIADEEEAGKKKKVERCAEQLSNHLTALANSQQLREQDHVDKTVQPIPDKESVDEAIVGMVTTSSIIDTDKLSTGQIVTYDASNEAHTAVKEEAVNIEFASVDQCKSSVPSTELDSADSGATNSGRVESDKENQCNEVAFCDIEIYTASNLLTVNAGNDRSERDGILEETLYPLDVEKDMRTAVQHDGTSNCDAGGDEQAVITEEPCVLITSVASDDSPAAYACSDQEESATNHHTCAVFHEDSKSSTTEEPTAASDDTMVPLSPSVLLHCDTSVSVTANAASTSAQHSHDDDVNKADVGNLSLTSKPAGVTEDSVSYDTVHCQNNNAVDVDKNHCSVYSSTLSHQDAECTTECIMECQQDIQQEMTDDKELTEKNLELKSVISVSDRDQKFDIGLEQIDSDSTYAIDIPSHLALLSAPNCSNERIETPVLNGACSGGFLAAFTQFVEKASVKKKSACCKHIETDNAATSAKEILSKSGSSQKCVWQRPCVSERQRRSCSGNRPLPKDRLPHRVVHRKSSSTVEHIVSEKSSLIETSSSEVIDCSKRLPCTAVDSEHATLSREQLLSVVEADRLLVTLRHRVCELVETVLPEYQFLPGFRRDSSCVERLVKDITDIWSVSEAHSSVQRCSDPVVVLSHMPDRCLQSLQQQVLRLISLLLPDTDLSEINVDNLDVFLELMTSANRPLPGTFCLSQPNLHLSHEACIQPVDRVEMPGQQLSPSRAETEFRCEQIDMSRTESHMSGVDALYGMPSCLLPINSPGPVGEKRSIRRQVKDCLMFLDRDLT